MCQVHIEKYVSCTTNCFKHPIVSNFTNLLVSDFANEETEAQSPTAKFKAMPWGLMHGGEYCDESPAEA